MFNEPRFLGDLGHFFFCLPLYSHSTSIIMKSFKIYYILLFIISGLNYNCNNNNPRTPGVNIPTGEITVDEFEQKLNMTPEAQVVDVRTPEEFNDGHLLTAINIDFKGTDFEYKIGALDKTKPTFVYCLSGNRSSKAADQMKNLGFTEIYQMKGGIKDWKKSGKALTSAEKSKDPKDLSLEDYNKQIDSEKLVLVDFNAPWCGPCKMMSPILDEISKEQENSLELLKINSDNNTSLSQSLNIENLPTLILYKKGKEVWKHIGYIDKIALMVAIESAK